MKIDNFKKDVYNLHWLNRCQNFEFQIALTFFLIYDFSWVCGRLRGLIMACMSDSRAYKIDILFNDLLNIYFKY